MSRAVAFEVQPGAHVRLVVTLTSGQRVEVLVKVSVVEVLDHEAVLANGAPSVGLKLHHAVSVRHLDDVGAPAAPPGVVTVGNKPN